jgi:hypothetical protein
VILTPPNRHTPSKDNGGDDSSVSTLSGFDILREDEISISDPATSFESKPVVTKTEISEFPVVSTSSPKSLNNITSDSAKQTLSNNPQNKTLSKALLAADFELKLGSDGEATASFRAKSQKQILQLISL